ncbi:MAG: hypothetical protein ABIS45_17005 [Burkholderiales bacterium]
MQRFLIAFLACAVALACAAAETAPVLKILATDPAPDVLLARQQKFFVRFELKSSQPATVSVNGWSKGKPVIDDGGTSAPAVLSAAGGIGVVNLFYWGEQPTRIDEVRLKISTAAGGTTLGEYTFPVALTWLTDDPPPREPAAWVTEWQRAQPAANTQKGSSRVSGSISMPGTGGWVGLAIAAALLAVAFARLRWRRTTGADGEIRQ